MNEQRKIQHPDYIDANTQSFPDVSPANTESLRKAVQKAKKRRQNRHKAILSSFLAVALFAAVGFFAFSELGKNITVSPKADETENPGDLQTSVPADSEAAVQNQEMRGVWIASTININYPSEPGLSKNQLQAELDDIVKKRFGDRSQRHFLSGASDCGRALSLQNLPLFQIHKRPAGASARR